MELDSVSATPVSSPAPASAPAAKSGPLTFQQRLARQIARIAAHATKVETLKNGATLYTLAGGREVEQAPGHTPYVVRHGTDATPPVGGPTTRDVADA